MEGLESALLISARNQKCPSKVFQRPSEMWGGHMSQKTSEGDWKALPTAFGGAPAAQPQI